VILHGDSEDEDMSQSRNSNMLQKLLATNDRSRLDT